jgi:hypothetical protein
MPSSCAPRAAPIHTYCSHAHMLHYRSLMFMCHQCCAAILLKLNLQPCGAHAIPYRVRCPCIHVMVHSYRARTVAYYDALHVCASAARFSMHLYAYIEAAITTHIAMLLILASICITTRIDVCEGQRCTFVTCMDMRLLRMHLHYIDRCAWLHTTKFCLQPHIFRR